MTTRLNLSNGLTNSKSFISPSTHQKAKFPGLKLGDNTKQDVGLQHELSTQPPHMFQQPHLTIVFSLKGCFCLLVYHKGRVKKNIYIFYPHFVDKRFTPPPPLSTSPNPPPPPPIHFFGFLFDLFRPILTLFSPFQAFFCNGFFQKKSLIHILAFYNNIIIN